MGCHDGIGLAAGEDLTVRLQFNFIPGVADVGDPQVRILARAAVSGKMFQGAAHAMPAVAFDDGQCVADHAVRFGPETAFVSGDDRVFRVEVQVDQRREIEVDAAGGHGGGVFFGVGHGQFRIVRLTQVGGRRP